MFFALVLPFRQKDADDLLERTGTGATDRRHDADTNIFFAVCFDLQIVKPLDAVLICKIRLVFFQHLRAARRDAEIGSHLRNTVDIKLLGIQKRIFQVIVFDVWLGEGRVDEIVGRRVDLL